MNDETDRYHALHNYKLFITPEHECSYLDAELSRTLFVDPNAELNTEHFSLFSELGFRRSGEHVYKPHCPACNECKPIRIDVKGFTATRSQRRCLARNRDIHLNWVAADFKQSHFDLYKRYMNHRHSESSMANDDPERYIKMMQASWCDTRLAEFFLGNKLIGVAITDWLVNDLSAVYTFFDPAYQKRSLGTFAILQQIQTARQTGRRHVYLGYWIEQCQKMSYKTRFDNIEIYDGHYWWPQYQLKF